MKNKKKRRRQKDRKIERQNGDRENTKHDDGGGSYIYTNTINKVHFHLHNYISYISDVFS